MIRRMRAPQFNLIGISALATGHRIASNRFEGKRAATDAQFSLRPPAMQGHVTYGQMRLFEELRKIRSIN